MRDSVSNVRCVRVSKLCRGAIAEIVGRQIGQQRHADVRRTGARRDDQVGILLDVVRRQPVVFGRDELLEVPPRLPRQLFEKLLLILGEPQRRLGEAAGSATRRPAAKPVQATSNGPATEQHLAMRRKPAPATPRRPARARTPSSGTYPASCRRRPVPNRWRSSIRAAVAWSRPCARSVRTIASALMYASYGKKTSVKHAAGPAACPAIATSPADACPAANRPACEASRAAAASSVGSRTTLARNSSDAAASGRRDEPRDEQHQQHRDRHQAAAQIVEDLPPRQGGDRIADALARPAAHPGQQPARRSASRRASSDAGGRCRPA